MGYSRDGETWDIINPLIELAQEMTSVSIWGQKIKWGQAWGGFANTGFYDQGGNTAAVLDLGEGLSIIDAILTITEGEIPENNMTWIFGPDGPVEHWEDATLAIGWRWSGVKAFVYLAISLGNYDWSAGFDSMFNNLQNNLTSRCGYHGFVPSAITDEDRSIFTAYFCTMSVSGDDTRGAYVQTNWVQVWQVGCAYNNNRSSEPLYILTNNGQIYHDLSDNTYKIPAADYNDSSASHTYYWLGSIGMPFHFPYDLAEDLNDFYEDTITEDQIGGDGDYDIGGDSLGLPDLPEIGILQSGMVQLYLPTALELKQFAQELWTDNASIASAFGAMVNSPIEAVINLGALPLNLSGYRDNSVAVQMGSYTMSTTMSPAKEEFYPFDFGTLRIPERWGSALDYSPYCKLNLYLPYVGYVDLPPEEVLGRYISVVYHINLFTGDFVAWVLTTYGSATNPLMQFTGNCMFKMPVTALDYSAYYKNQHDLFAGAVSNFASGNILGGIIDSVAFAAGSAQPSANVRRNGEFNGSTAIMAYPQPFIIRTTARQVFQGSKQDQSGFDKYSGFPCYKILDLYEGMGYTKITDMIMDGFTLTDEEEKELRTLLQEGVYL